jgi:hypothetical protein
MTCTHDIIEKDNACADGMCPICLAADNDLLRAAIEMLRKTADADGFHRVLAARDHEIAQLTAVLETIAGTAKDKLQAMQARSGLARLRTHEHS